MHANLFLGNLSKITNSTFHGWLKNKRIKHWMNDSFSVQGKCNKEKQLMPCMKPFYWFVQDHEKQSPNKNLYQIAIHVLLCVL